MTTGTQIRVMTTLAVPFGMMPLASQEHTRTLAGALVRRRRSGGLTAQAQAALFLWFFFLAVGFDWL